MDNKQKIQLLITGALVVLLAFLLFTNLRPKKKRRPAKKATPAAVPNNPATPLPKVAGEGKGPEPGLDAMIALQLGKISGESLEVKDPFYRIEEGISSKRGSLVLKAISWKPGGRSFALINEEIVTEGDKIGDTEVIEVREKSVLLEKGGQQYILKLEE